MRLLPKEQWIAVVESGVLLLSAWGSGPDGDLRHWLKFETSGPRENCACLNDLEGVLIDVVDRAAVTE